MKINLNIKWIASFSNRQLLKSLVQILTFKFVICVNAFPQSPHTYGRTWEWIRSWFRRLAACVNAMEIKNKRMKKKIGYQSIFNFRFFFQWIKLLIYFFDKLNTGIFVQPYDSECVSITMIFWQKFLSTECMFLLHRTSIALAVEKKNDNFEIL